MDALINDVRFAMHTLAWRPFVHLEYLPVSCGILHRSWLDQFTE